jgi:hypothetical protein
VHCLPGGAQRPGEDERHGLKDPGNRLRKAALGLSIPHFSLTKPGDWIINIMQLSGLRKDLENPRKSNHSTMIHRMP